MATAEANDLITEVTQLPVQPGAAMRLLWMLEDPRTSAADLGRLIESDPALSTQVIRLSNTAFYGLSGKVSSAWRAVTVLGLATFLAGVYSDWRLTLVGVVLGFTVFAFALLEEFFIWVVVLPALLLIIVGVVVYARRGNNTAAV